MLALSPTQTTMTAVGDTGCRRKKDIYRKNIFSYRFVMNQILFLENKNKIKNGPRGSRQANEKRVEGLNKENIYLTLTLNLNF